MIISDLYFYKPEFLNQMASPYLFCSAIYRPFLQNFFARMRKIARNRRWKGENTGSNPRVGGDFRNQQSLCEQI